MKGKLLANFFIGIGTVLIAVVFGMLIAKTGYLSALLIPVIFAVIILAFLVFRKPELGWFLIVFFLPFERVPSIELAGINLKINTFLGFLTLLAWILAILANYKKYKISPNALSIPLSLFIIALLLSLTQAQNLSRAVVVLTFILFTIALAILAVNFVNNRENLQKTIFVLFLSSLIVGLFGLFQFGGDVIGLPQTLTLLKEGYTSKVFGFPRIQAFSMEPLYLANYLLIPLSIGLALFVNRQNEPIKRSWLVILLVLLMVNFILTVSRGGYLGLVGTCLVLFFFFLRRLLTWKNILIAAVAAAVIIYGVAFALARSQYRATNEFLGHIQFKDITEGESIEGRLVTFKNALRAYGQSPWLGIGVGNYGPWAKNYPPVAPKTGWDIVNNQYIELLAETGLVGLVAFIIMLIVLIVRSLVALRYTTDIFLKSVLIGLLAALIGILIQYNFMSTLYIIHIWVLIGMLIAVQNIILNCKSEAQNPKS